MFSRRFSILLACIFISSAISAQDCKLKIEGRVIDEGSGIPLTYVNVIIQELSKGTITDDEGYFLFQNLCQADYHLIFSHIGCDSKKVHAHIHGDTIMEVLMPHTSTSLDGVVVTGKKNSYDNQPSLSVNRQAIEDNANQNLSGLLEKEAGVNVLKNGSGIAKPIVHGLYGNRLTILNNGIAQSGQQWGNDHSPEIDPFSADKITVLKGANALDYGNNNLGSVILVEPKKIGREPHLHGQVNYTYETNGRGNTINTRLEKYNPLLAWRINGTLKKSGDQKTADYFLNNTGGQEANFSIQLEKSWREKLFIDFYASTFNTKLGILRGSHIGNITDLELALEKDIPFFTEAEFSYEIEAPKQLVNHHLSKIKAKYYISEDQTLEFVLAGQLNDRKEFDVRRSGRTDLPALSLNQLTFDGSFKYARKFNYNWTFKSGNSTVVTDNTNNPETGVLPLIPDYISFKNGTFTTLSKDLEKTNISFGIRYDYERQNVLAISRTLPRKILRFENNFHNLGGVFTLKYKVSPTQNLTVNSGYAMRNPAINELYSNGLHQGVSGIEEGDTNLDTEKAIKNTLEYKWLPNAQFSINALVYHQHFKNYIYLNPQDEFRLTIRGAFPVFRYEQTDANIYGLDLSSQFMIQHSLFGQLQFSYIKGNDIGNDRPLVFIPASNVYASLTYRSKNTIKISSTVNLDELELELNNRQVFRQHNLQVEQDFVAPPPAYNLFGSKFSSNIILPKYKFRVFIKVENLFNIKYRDYLNRQRYFADDTGISLVLGANFKF